MLSEGTRPDSMRLTTAQNARGNISRDGADARACCEGCDGGVVARGARAESKLGQKLGQSLRPLRARTPARRRKQAASCLHRNPDPHLTRHNHHLAACPERAESGAANILALGRDFDLSSRDFDLSSTTVSAKTEVKVTCDTHKSTSMDGCRASAGVLLDALRLSLPWHPRATNNPSRKYPHVSPRRTTCSSGSRWSCLLP